MKTSFYLSILLFSGALALSSCATSGDNRPIPGTLESTSSKNSENNTPRTNPTPNPEPASNPPGPDSDRRVYVH